LINTCRIFLHFMECSNQWNKKVIVELKCVAKSFKIPIRGIPLSIVEVFNQNGW
jgi:hypothetical protein